MDELSNGGLFASDLSADSLAQQLCPGSLRQCNYGSSDYDIRNNFNADFVVHPSYHFGNSILNYALGGWEWSGKIFWRSGLPFSIIDGNTSGGIPNNTAVSTLRLPDWAGQRSRSDELRRRRCQCQRDRNPVPGFGGVHRFRVCQLHHLSGLLTTAAQPVRWAAFLRHGHGPVQDL